MQFHLLISTFSRFTAANSISIVSKPILASTTSRKLLINFSEIILILLRDDSVAVRDKISDFVFQTTHEADGEIRKGRVARGL